MNINEIVSTLEELVVRVQILENKVISLQNASADTATE